VSFFSRHANLKIGVPSISLRREKKGRLRRDARVGYRGVSGFYDPAIRLLPFLKIVSRRREKKGRLRRDARLRYRGVTSGLTSETHEVSRSAFCSFYDPAKNLPT